MNLSKKNIAFFFISCILSGFGVSGHAAEKETCEALELVEGNVEYNQLVCKGVRQMQLKNYSEAVKFFEEAMQKKLFEFPNFKLYPRLTLAYLGAGNVNKAKENLTNAELSLSILIGAVRCEETDKGFRLVNKDGSIVQIPSQNITQRMCGAAYEYIYTQPSFKSTLYNAELIKIYLQAKKEVESKN